MAEFRQGNTASGDIHVLRRELVGTRWTVFALVCALLGELLITFAVLHVPLSGPECSPILIEAAHCSSEPCVDAEIGQPDEARQNLKGRYQ
jgi:hypothetical protein